jgi:ubiquinone/menaquinone biosynthesis C-methylase UbiE
MSQQTWWDKEIKDQFLNFKSWVGDSKAPSKVWARSFVKENGWTTLLDIGCGNATEFFAYKQEYPELEYTGVDSSRFLNEFNISKHIPMVLAEADNIDLKDGFVEVAFSRHVLEHQDKPYPILDEMIRLANKVAIHIFFIPPGDTEIISYDKKQNLYHNTYNKKEIEDYLSMTKKVKTFHWVPLPNNEEALVIYV